MPTDPTSAEASNSIKDQEARTPPPRWLVHPIHWHRLPATIKAAIHHARHYGRCQLCNSTDVFPVVIDHTQHTAYTVTMQCRHCTDTAEV